MKVQSLGHVVLRVRDQDRAEAFYNGVLGLSIAARDDRAPMTFFTLGDNHHDLAIMALGDDAEAAAKGVGLDHVAFKIGDSDAELKEAKSHLEAAGVAVTPVDHGITHSLYFNDPDGNGLEVYVDVSDDWKTDPQSVAQSRPLKL